MSGLDEKSIWNENIILQHAYRIHLVSKESISYKDAQSLVKGLIQEYELANGVNTSKEQLTIPDVSKQRELLLAFAKHIEKAGYDGSCLTYEQELDEFLKANNCG